MDTFLGTKQTEQQLPIVEPKEVERAKDQKQITENERTAMHDVLSGMFAKGFGTGPFTDTAKYAKKTGKTLVDLFGEIKEKKSPLSATARRMITTAEENNRFKYLALALGIQSGLSADDDFEIIEYKE